MATAPDSRNRYDVPALLLWLPLAAMLLLAGAELIAMLSLNNGKLVYTLDDPYIHFALAENLLNGHYGVNSSEPSAPSSSVIWAFLLTPFAAMPGFEYCAFVFNLVAAGFTMVLYGRIVAVAIAPAESPARFWLAVVITIVLIPATNVVGLVFTGMEHSFQLLTAAIVVYGLIGEARNGKLPLWLLAAIVAGPLFRYENLAVAAPALGYLFVRGHFKASVLAGIAVLLPLAAFSVFLNANDLGWMPTSVNAKSGVVTTDGAVSSLLGNVFVNLHYRQGLVVAAFTVALLVTAALPRVSGTGRLLAAAGGLGGVLHMFVGQIGWYDRYEIYILAFLLLIAIYVWRKLLRAFVDRQRPLLAIPLTAAVIAFCGATYWTVLVTIPLASNNIYQQQYQMHRFIDEFYQGPVAVNDLGWVAFQNEHYVLDLYGLASREALDYRRSATDSTWMNELADRHDVRLAMIYERWFRDLPPNWRQIGKIHLGRTRVTPAFTSVAIYALDDATEESVNRMMDEFAPSLPEGVIYMTLAEERALSEQQ